MTPDCCKRAWAKATGRGPLFIHGGAWAVRNEEPYGADGPVSWVPKPTSAEWLAEIVEAADYCVINVFVKAPCEVDLSFPHGAQDVEHRASGPDLRRALCAALNGSPCEREAA